MQTFILGIDKSIVLQTFSDKLVQVVATFLTPVVWSRGCQFRKCVFFCEDLGSMELEDG